MAKIRLRLAKEITPAASINPHESFSQLFSGLIQN